MYTYIHVHTHNITNQLPGKGCFTERNARIICTPGALGVTTMPPCGQLLATLVLYTPTKSEPFNATNTTSENDAIATVCLLIPATVTVLLIFKLVELRPMLMSLQLVPPI